MGYDHNDPSLRTGADGLTVWTLHEMAQAKQFKELNDLFNNGLTMNALPVGLAAGAAARVLDIDNKVIADAIDALTGKNWRGKVFFPSDAPWLAEFKRELLMFPNGAHDDQVDAFSHAARGSMLSFNHSSGNVEPCTTMRWKFGTS